MAINAEDQINTYFKENGFTFGKAATFSAGLTSSAGTTALGAVTATTINASSTLEVGGASTLTGAVNFKRQVTDTGGAYATPIALTAAQSGRVILVDDAAGLDFTLPALTSAEIGVHYKFLVTVSVTSNAFRVVAASGDIMFGGVVLFDFDTADANLWCPADGSNDLTMAMNGTTTGGKMGTWVEFTATSATQWVVNGIAIGDGTLATPFS